MLGKMELGHELKIRWDKIRRASGQTAPFYGYAWHDTWFRTLGAGWAPYIIYISGVIAPFARQGEEVIFSGGREGTDYADLIGTPGDLRAAWPGILAFIKGDGIGQVTLANVPEDSATVDFFRGQGAAVEKEDTTPVIALPASWEAYLDSLPRKSRHELLRKTRKFEREHPGSSLGELNRPEQITSVLLRLMRLHSEKNIFLTPQMERFFGGIIRAYADALWFPVLREGGTETACALAFVTRDTVFLYNSGFDRELAPGAGFYLKAKMIEAAIGRGLTRYNFLQGSERYKYELGGRDFTVYTIKLALSQTT